jgi:plasmid maintenance system antidote protein VapI
LKNLNKLVESNKPIEMLFEQNTITKSFVDEISNLIQSGEANNYKEVADRIEWDKTAISNVVNGRRNIPASIYKKFTEEFGISRPQPGDFREKYYALLEARFQEQAKAENLFRELMQAIHRMETGNKKTEQSLDQMRNSLAVATAMTFVNQEWMIESLCGNADKARKVMTGLRKKAVERLTTFSTTGIQIDTGSSASGR